MSKTTEEKIDEMKEITLTRDKSKSDKNGTYGLMELLTLILYIGLEAVKRLLSPLLYPAAYAFRGRIRNKKHIIWPGYLYEPARGLHGFLFWCLLDDSLMFSQAREYDNKESRYPAFIWKTQSPFLLAWWWAAVRNSCVNWNNYSAWMLGAYSHTIKRYGGDKNFIEVRVYQGGKIRCYIEFWLFGRWNQIGWLRGNSATNGASRFEIDIMKVKK